MARYWLAVLAAVSAVVFSFNVAHSDLTQFVHGLAKTVCSVDLRPNHVHCLAQVVTTDGVRPLAASAPVGYGPSDLRAAYNVTSTGSAGTTIAIVDSFGYPNAESDLASYRAQFGLPACTIANGCLSIVNQNGQTSPLPSYDEGWAQEQALDLDMASAMCSSCKVLLVQASSTSLDSLAAAEKTAARMGAHAISNSYGADEASAFTQYESAYDVPGVAVTVSSGDSGYGVQFPASSPHVISVGGTSLSKASNARGWSESAWSGSGSGCSKYFAKPTWQKDTGCPNNRTVADVSAVADPNTGVAVYGPNGNGGTAWQQFGGTSVAAPIIAGIYAVANTTVNYASQPYANASSLNDVTSGSNGSCGGSYLCTGKSGYDGPTGLGTPNGLTAFGGSSTPPPTGTRTLKMTVVGAGQVTSNPPGVSCGSIYDFDTQTCSGTFAAGTSVTLTAAAQSWTSETGWTGGGCSVAATTCTIPMTADQNVTAYFGKATQTLNVSVTGNGSVVSQPEAIKCAKPAGPGQSCASNFTSGTSVSLTAAPAAGFTFAGWSGGGCAGTSAVCTVPLTSAQSVTAAFTSGTTPAPIPLSLAVNGNGTVTSNPSGINCANPAGTGQSCASNFPPGTAVTLTAAPATGYNFTGWSGGGCTGSATTCTVTLTSAQSVAATFAQPTVGPVTLGVSLTGNGLVSSSPSGINCANPAASGQACTANYQTGTSVTLTAAPSAGYTFAGWSGGCSGTANTCSIAMNNNKSVTALFTATTTTPKKLTVTVNGSGSVQSTPSGISCGNIWDFSSTSCAATYPAGTTVTLTATPQNWTSLKGWSGGGCSGTKPTCTVVMSADLNVTATF